jgi:hypothetical protein
VHVHGSRQSYSYDRDFGNAFPRPVIPILSPVFQHLVYTPRDHPNPTPTQRRDDSVYRVPIAHRCNTLTGSWYSSYFPNMFIFLTPDRRQAEMPDEDGREPLTTKGHICGETYYGYTVYVWLHVSCGSDSELRVSRTSQVKMGIKSTRLHHSRGVVSL